MKPPTLLELQVDLCRELLLKERPSWTTASVLNDEPRCHQIGAFHAGILTTFIAEVRETFYGPAFCVRVIHEDKERARYSLLCGVEPPVAAIVKAAERFVEENNL